VLAVVVAFVSGAAGGFFYGRRHPASIERGPAPATPAPPVGRTPEGAPVLASPNKRGRKAGLTEADFTPSDDILDKLRKAEAGELDPTVLKEEAQPPKPKAKRATKAQPALDPTTMSEAERRVFDRLRRMEEEAPPAE
jgi:hypothetical protein